MQVHTKLLSAPLGNHSRGEADTSRPERGMCGRRHTAEVDYMIEMGKYGDSQPGEGKLQRGRGASMLRLIREEVEKCNK